MNNKYLQEYKPNPQNIINITHTHTYKKFKRTEVMSYTSIKSTKRSKKEQKSLIRNMVETLVSLDNTLCPQSKSPSREKLPDLGINKTQLKGMYKDFIKKFLDVGELEESVLIYAVALAKVVVREARKSYSFKKGEFILIFAACLYLSIKLLIDEERWFVADFSYVSSLDESHIQKMEQFVLVDILSFDLKIPDSQFRKEEKLLRGF